MSIDAVVRIGVLLPIDAIDAALARSTLAAAAQMARRLRIGFDVVAVGSNPATAVATAMQTGAVHVLCAVQANLSATSQGHQWAAAFERALPTFQHSGESNRRLWLFPAQALGVEIAARLAMRQGGVALGCCDADLGLDADGATLTSAAFGGRAVVRLTAATGPWFATLRGARIPAKATTADLPTSDTVSIHTVTLDGALPDGLTITRRPAAGRAVDPAQSDVVVTGGRGMGGSEGFELLDRLATALGGTWAGSLPAVDAGWVPVTRQVGQSGCYVSPSLYVAVGVSGTPQHMAGIAPGTRIVAINSDADADIFRYAEIGVVADWRTLLPPLLDRLAARETVDASQS